MSQFPTRRPLSSLCLALSAAAVLGTAGCSTGGGNRQPETGVTSLSQLPNKAQSMLKLGDASRAAGDCTAALRFYGMVIGQGNDKHAIAAAQLGAGECDLAMGNAAEAEKAYLAAAKLVPHDAAAMVGLGRVYLIEHQPERAAGYFDRAVKSGANEAFVWNDKGVTLDQLGRHAEAQEAYRQGLDAHPGDPALRNNLALSLAMTGNFPEAEGLLRQLADAPDATARTRENLALVLGLAGNDAGAREVSAQDLDGAALDNNARFYDYARALLAGNSSPAAGLAAAGGTHVPASEALAAATIPPPVLVMHRRPAHAAAIATPAITETAAAPIPEPGLRKSDSGMTALLPDGPAANETAAAMPAPPAPSALTPTAAAPTPLAPPLPTQPVASSDED
jgi:Flp pilus assembly protein TadD